MFIYIDDFVIDIDNLIDYYYFDLFFNQDKFYYLELLCELMNVLADLQQIFLQNIIKKLYK